MTQIRNIAGTLAVLGALSACGGMVTEETAAALSVDVIEETNLEEVLLTTADPNDAIRYFRGRVAEDPDSVEAQRGLARALARAGQHGESGNLFARIVQGGEATDQDRLGYAESLIRANDIEGAKAQLDSIPPSMESYRRYLLEAVVADRTEDWERADHFYATARGLTMEPSKALNNWGISRMARGEYAEAERLFQEALTFNPDLASAKTNLVIARGNQGKFSLPPMRTTEVERAELLYNLALLALRSDQVETARGLLEQAVSTHPRHFNEAREALTALGGPVVR